MRSKETGQHVKRVAEFSHLFAVKHGMSEDEAELLRLAAPMHDIGKIAIPDSILHKPGKLTPEEWTEMKAHTTLGYEILKHSERRLLKAAAIVANEHHEKWDGSGYPNGIKGEKIHVYGRITAMADVFDALCILDGMAGDFERCTFRDMDIHPCEGGGALNVFDIFATLDSIAGTDACCGP